MRYHLGILGIGMAIISLGACASGGRDTGINVVRADEFRVVTKAPLTVPPDYNLRPPMPGQARPAEIIADSSAVNAFGTNVGVNASPGERALISAANAQAVSPVIRSQVDFEEAAMLRKSPTLADRVLFWRDDEEARAIAESDSATGGAAVTIEESDGRRVKLPGT